MPLSPIAQVIESLDRLAGSASVSREQFIKAMLSAVAVFPGGPSELVRHLVAKLNMDQTDAADYVRGRDYPVESDERKMILKAVSDELYRKNRRS